MKRIPYGLSNFKSIIEENYFYVDKTKYIEIIENLNEKYIIFLRPRRFGKSLFTSVLDYYYSRCWKNEKLFDNLYIGKNPTPLRGSYIVLNFSFAGINTDTEEHTINGFNGNVRNGINDCITLHALGVSVQENMSAADMLAHFLSDVRKVSSEKIYIIIDEYDHFANELLSFNYDIFRDSVSTNGFVRKFYEQIKECTRSGLVDRIYITGVTSITLDSMTSGFNIASNLTSESMLHEMLGFTEDEVNQLSAETIGEEIVTTSSAHIAKLKNYYNGYLFNKDGAKRLYNSDMILYYFNIYQRKNAPPEEMVDRNVVSDYGKIEAVFRLGGFDDERLDTLKKLIQGEDIEVAVTEKFNTEHAFLIDDFKSILFYMGFITIKKVDEIGRLFMNVPNHVIKEIYFDYFQALIQKETSFNLDNGDAREAIANIAIEGDPSKLIKITEDTLHRLSNRDFIKFDEKYIKVIMLNFLFKSNVYYTKSEYEVEDGYIDIVLLPGNVGAPRFYACFEIKYISKKEAGNKGFDKAVQTKLDDAKAQLTKYGNAEELKKLPNFKKFAIVFCDDKCVRLEEA